MPPSFYSSPFSNRIRSKNECRAQLQQAQRQYDWRKQPKQRATTSAKSNQGLGSWVVLCSPRRCDLWCVAVVVRTDLVAAQNDFSIAALHHRRHALGRAGKLKRRSPLHKEEMRNTHCPSGRRLEMDQNRIGLPSLPKLSSDQ